MLDDEKTQSIYQALRNSPGLSSPAGTKATAALDKASGLKDRFTSLTDLPEDTIPLPGEVATKIPPELRNAVTKFNTYSAGMKNSNDVLSSLGGAIDKRMEDVTSKFAVLGVAANVAQKMGDAAGGCGPLGAAFSVLTSSGRIELLRSAMEMAEGPLGELEGLVGRYKNSLTGIMSDADKELLGSLTAAMDAINEQIAAASAVISELVAEAEAMWDHLMTTFNMAVQSSILGSIINNPCLRDIADSVMPDNVKSVIDGFKL